jgi:glycine dehydrogenase subunit 1
VRITKSKRVAISRLIHPHYRRVVQTYFEPTGCEVIELPYLLDGRTDPSSIEALKDTAAVAVQSPNFLGCVEDLQALAEKTHGTKALFVAAFSEPLAYGLYKNPGSLGADIACGEGQSLGIPQSFGGPGLGMFATKMAHVRNMPGRVAGKTVDLEGRRGFVLTLATREQHIRREKATSNICTNHSLCALSAAIYMALLGRTGIRELARLNHDKAEYLKGKLGGIGFKIPFPSPTFNEFVVEVPDDFEKTYQELLKKGIVAGLPLSLYYPELPRHYLICVTETKTKEAMDKLVMEVQS